MWETRTYSLVASTTAVGVLFPRVTPIPPPPLPLPETYDKPLGGNVAEEAFCQKPAPMGWVHCVAVPPLGAGPAWMTTGGRGRRLLVCRMFPFPKRGNWTKGSK